MAKHISRSIRSVTQKARERYGFAYAEILSQWTAIVGADLAGYCAPERIRWPSDPYGDGEGRGVRGRRKSGGVLIIRVADGRAIELQHDTPYIMDRVNTYYGYQAITEIKIIQGTLPSRDGPAAPPPQPSAEQERIIAEDVRDIDDEALKAALVKLGRGALPRARATGSSQSRPETPHSDSTEE